MSTWRDGDFVPVGVPFDIVNAIECVSRVFRDALASGKHKPGDWRALGVKGNSEHFDEHYSKINYAKLAAGEEFGNEDDLAFMCCRALMLLQLREESRRK